MTESTPDLKSSIQGPGPDHGKDESPVLGLHTTAESISDDQELFLKVLENLKNAVTKPDSHVALPKRQTIHENKSVDVSTASALNSEPQIAELESHSIKSEEAEPGTTTITVSDKTKSLILQKLASEKVVTAGSLGVGLEQGDALVAIPVPYTVAQAILQTPEVAKSVEISTSLTANLNEKSPQKTLYSARSVEYVNRGNTNKITDKTERTNQKQGTNSVQLYPCSFCDYYSNNKSYLKQHIDIVHISDRPFKCPYCEYAGKRSHALREHLIVHTDERPFQCSVCKATFRKKGHLTNHVKLHNSKRLVKCPLCKALVYDTGENGLDAHLKNDHDTERLYGCDLCEYIAANEPDILKHLKLAHKTHIASQKCEKCPFETANSIDFTAHVNAHKLSESSVQIGENGPTEVIGVATIPKGSENLGLPNAVVKIKDPEAGSASAQKQPAAIKPVWIKCSECGFTGQDSEVIRKHMIEHLKDQGYEVVQEVSEAPLIRQLHGVSVTVPSQSYEPRSSALLPPGSSESIAKSSSEPQILVPVTNIDKLLPQHASKVDMNSPILVPVTDAATLKKLHQLPSSSFQQMTTTRVQTTSSAEINSNLNTKQIGIVSVVPSNTLNSGLPIITASADIVAAPSPVAVFPNLVGVFMAPGTSVSSQSPAWIKQVVPQNSHSIIQMTNKSSLSSLSTGTSNIVMVPQQTVHSSAVMRLSVPSVIPRSAAVQVVETSAIVKPRQSGPPSVVSQIPVPRMMAPPSPPRLPPEITRIPHPITSEDNLKEQQSVEDPAHDTNLAMLKEGLVQVQRLVEDQEKLTRRHGIIQDTTSQSGAKNMVVYIKPVVSQNLADKSSINADFTHDSTAGHYKCTICGYTCEHQRTIKAHIWKHSGNKNIDYPMFQNGPLSVYDDDSLPRRIEGSEKSIEVFSTYNEILNKYEIVKKTPGLTQIVKNVSEINASSVRLPPFIVYEKTKISNVAPALAHMIAAKTLKEAQKADTGSKESSVTEETEDMPTEESSNMVYIDHDASEECGNSNAIKTSKPEYVAKTVSNLSTTANYIPRTIASSSSRAEYGPRTISTSSSPCLSTSVNVVVETITEDGAVDGFTGYTAMQSQQNSPRVANNRSPDSGITEMSSTVRSMEDTATISSNISETTNTEKRVLRSGSKRSHFVRSSENQEDNEESEHGSSSKKVKVLGAHEDSAVTLLSLLKKGPNYNPACPTRPGHMTSGAAAQVDYSNVSSPGVDDSNSLEGSEISGSKPKSGISTSLLAVIEQLRERSKSDADDDRPLSLPAKKQTKRRSRRSSQEDNTPASGIDNVEEFTIDGEVKFRCKLCHYTNESTLLLRQHMRMHKPKQEFECSLCDLIADSSEALQDHMIQHCKVRTYQCKMCNSTFNYKSQLRAHMRMHNDQDIMYCDYCDFESRNLAAMKLHNKSHLSKPYKCEICHEEFITSFNLRIHKREGCKYERAHFKCEECDFVFFGRREMKNHLRLHMGRNTTKILNRCPYCEHADTSIENVQKHVADVHGESKPLKCDMCGFFAVSIRSLKSHMKRHVNDQRFVAQPLEQYKCNLCGYVCHHLPSLKSHMWRHAADEHYSYEFTNDVINAAIDFDSQTEVTETNQVHVDSFKELIFEKMKAKGLENTHETYEESAVACCWVTFRCCQCGFETINKAELNMHMSAHSDVIKMTLEISSDQSVEESQGLEVELP